MKRSLGRAPLVPVPLVGPLVGAFVVALVSGAGCAPRASAPTTLKPAQIAERSKIGTVLVMIRHSADVTVPRDTELVPGGQERLVAAAQARVKPGMTQADLVSILFDELLANWRDYLRPVGTRTLPASITSVGSGFFVTPDGYVVTNAHVVGTDEKELKLEFAQKALGTLLDEAVADVSKSLGSLTEDRRKRLASVAAQFYVENMSFGEMKREASLVTSAGPAGMGTVSKPIPAEIVPNGVGEPIPGKDVAVMKASGDNFPTLRLGDDKSVTTGQEIYPFGFPADATFYPSFDPSSATEPSFTRGVVSARKTMAGGWEVIQTDAAIRGGNSGGPVLDEKGEVIGLATFGLIDQKSGASAQGANFVVPTAIVREILGRANVTPKESPVSKDWNEAQSAMDASRYREATAKLDEIETLHPGMPAVAAAKSRAATAIREGKEAASPLAVGPLAVVGGVLAAVGAIAAAFLAGRRRGPGVPPAVPPAPPAPPSAPPRVG